MTTPDGRPSVEPSATVVGGLQGDGEAQRQAGINPETTLIGTDADEGVYLSDGDEDVTAPRGPQD